MDEAYRKAQKKVKRKKEFYKELGAFVPIAIGLMVLNFATNPGYLWFLWAVLPWGITIVIKGVKLNIDDKTSEWEDSEMRKELKAMGKNPDDYIDAPLELKEIEVESVPNQQYRDSDFV